MSFIVEKKKTVISSPARSCFFLSQIVTINGLIPILSSFLNNKLDIFMVITLIIAKILKVLPV